MELQLPQLSVYDYNHGGRVLLTKKRKMAFLLSLVFALAFCRLLFPFGLLVLAVPVLVYMRGERTLKLGPRYLICGDRIVYYANVQRVVCLEAQGLLKLRLGVKTELVLERKRFKGRSVRDESFRKVTAEVMERVGRVAPQALLADEDVPADRQA